MAVKLLLSRTPWSCSRFEQSFVSSSWRNVEISFTANKQRQRSNVGIALCVQEGTPSVSETSEELVAPGKIDPQLLWRAVKLPIYSVAVAPLSVGSAAAFLESGVFDAAQFWSLLVSAVLVITWLNLSNDAYDSETGVDKHKKESVVNITGSQGGVLTAAHACLALGCFGLARGALLASDARVALLLAAAISCGYVYQCPPFRLSYKGLGEPLCFLSFGPLATTAFYLSQSTTRLLKLTPAIFGASAIVGVTTTLILFCSHFHQIEGDTAVGKISPLVRLGTLKASKIVHFAVAGLYASVSALAAAKILPLPCALLCMGTLPLGQMVVDFITTHHEDKQTIFLAKYYCVRLHVAFNAALTLGLLLQRLWLR